jgi:RNA polymerase sigma-70 factor (ECF subfamily)
VNARRPAGPARVDGDRFATTHWTVVLAAGGKPTPAADQALAELCRTYWYPLYAYARRRGYSKQDAEDLTQGFFARFLRRNYLDGLSREKGRFRAFLLACMKHFLADEWDRASAARRDVQRTVPLDPEAAERRYLAEPVDNATPERLFEQQWALTLLETAVQRLHRDYEAAGQGAMFVELRFALTGDRSAVPYAELAARLGMSPQAVRVAVHRLRRRYRQILRQEIAHTVTEVADVGPELDHLRQALSA